jgi:hypothetical protein
MCWEPTFWVGREFWAHKNSRSESPDIACTCRENAISHWFGIFNTVEIIEWGSCFISPLKIIDRHREVRDLKNPHPYTNISIWRWALRPISWLKPPWIRPNSNHEWIQQRFVLIFVTEQMEGQNEHTERRLGLWWKDGEGNHICQWLLMNQKCQNGSITLVKWPVGCSNVFGKRGGETEREKDPPLIVCPYLSEFHHLLWIT